MRTPRLSRGGAAASAPATGIPPGLASRRGALRLALAGAASFGPASAARAAQAPRIEVWQDPACGCCEGWVRHMRAAGFEVAVRKVADVRPVKVAMGVDEALWSCHTAVVDGFVIEGHVPAADVRRLLAERPGDATRSRPQRLGLRQVDVASDTVSGAEPQGLVRTAKAPMGTGRSSMGGTARPGRAGRAGAPPSVAAAAIRAAAALLAAPARIATPALRAARAGRQ